MIIGIPRERVEGEKRVAITPAVVKKLIENGHQVLLESKAGDAASFPDKTYEEAGAKVVGNTADLYGSANLVVKVNPPQGNELKMVRNGTTLIGLLNPLGNTELVKQLAAKKVTAFAMEMIPRISRAQSMDALSSQANIAGYKSVLLAASHLGKFFPMLTTAAGTIKPAKVIILGVGVAGLQAIATARRLGAIVEAYDIRPEVAEQIRSLGATPVEIKLDEETATKGGYAKEASSAAKIKIQEVVASHVAAADVVITTAQIPGRKAPLLVTKETVERMHPGAVVVDLAAGQGGNVAVSEAGKTIDYKGVTIMGPTNLPGLTPIDASQLYAKNILSLLTHLTKDESLNLDFDDEITKGSCITHEGEIRMKGIS